MSLVFLAHFKPLLRHSLCQNMGSYPEKIIPDKRRNSDQVQLIITKTYKEITKKQPVSISIAFGPGFLLLRRILMISRNTCLSRNPRMPWTKRPTLSILAITSATLLWNLMSGTPVMAATAPTITSYSTSTTNGTTTVTINGQNLGTTDQGASVTIGSISTPIDSWSNTSIQVTLPQNAGPGSLAVTTPSGTSNSVTFAGVQRGYYVLSSKGIVTATGDVQFYGDLSTIGASTSSAAIQLIPTPSYQGYWIVTQNGGVYAFGNATKFTNTPSNITAVSMAVTPSGQGAYLLANNGTVYALGNAVNYGNAPSGVTASSIASTPDGLGYWVLGVNGTVYAFGDAQSYGNATIPTTKSSATSPTTSQSSYPNGSLLRVQGHSAVFYVQNGTLHHIPDAPLFLNLGLSWSQVHTVSSLASETLGSPLVAPFPSGSLIQPAGHRAIYLVIQGVLRHIGSPSVLYQMGYNFSEVQHVASINAHWPVGPALNSAIPYAPSGTLFQQNGQPAVYAVINGHLSHIMSGSVFLAMGYQWSQVHHVASLPNLPSGTAITSPDRVYPTGTLIKLNGAAAVYLVQNGVLRHIGSPSILYAMGYTFADVQNVSTLGSLPIGSAVGSTTLPGTSSGSSPSSTAVSAVSIVPTVDGRGYWILESNGKVATMGDATSYGSATSSQMSGQSAIGIAMTPDLQGYEILTSSGQLLPFGDGTTMSNPSNATSLMISPEHAGKVLSMGYGFFNIPYSGFSSASQQANSGYGDLQRNGSQLSVIQPAWFNVSETSGGSWNVGMWASSKTVTTVTNQAHQENVAIMPSIGSYYNPANGPISTAKGIQSMVSQITTLVTNNNWDGITIDFEASGAYTSSGMTKAEASQQYTQFVAALGPALHAMGKKLMVAVYPTPYPNTIYNYAAIAPYVNWINIMTYPEHNSGTWPGPTAGYPWVQNLVSQALATGVSPQQFILGIAPYGHYWVLNNQGINQGLSNPPGYQTNRGIQAFLQAHNITPLWDPNQKEIVFTSGAAAVAPTQSLSVSNSSTFDPQVQNLQGLLNYILLRYALQNNQTPRPLLWTDGYFGTATESAIQAFQQDFNVTGDPSGTYGPATQAALTQVISNWNIGQNQWWDETSRSFKDRLNLAIQTGMGGVASWRMPFESQGYWNTLATDTTVIHYPNPTN